MRGLLKYTVLLLAAFCLAALIPAARAETVIRYGMSLSDVPLTTGQPNSGAGAYQFTGHTLYDPLVAWEMNVADRPGKLIPGLATTWTVDPQDKTKWRFTLRQGVKFHDGSLFDADAVIWNLEKVLNDKSPQYDPKQAAQVRPRIPSIKSYTKVDAATVEIVTKEVDAFFPYQLPWFLISSPAQFDKLGRDWDKFGNAPSGTGPFRQDKLIPRERLEMVRNPEYWDKTRLPKVDRMILLCIPEAATRTNALLSGEVDVIETPSPDAVDRLKQAGMRIVTNVSPHVWPYHLSMLPDSPWLDQRVRRAANLAIDRDGILVLLNGLGKAAKGQVDAGSPWFGKPGFDIKYDPAAAKTLMEQAGYSPTKRLKATFVIAQGGTGQMLSLPMNEFVQQNLKEIYIDLDFKVVDLETLYTHWRAGAKADLNKGISGINLAYLTSDPFYAFARFLDSRYTAPSGVNWGWYRNDRVDALLTEARTTFDPAQQDELMARIDAIFVDEAQYIWVVHDVNPHAMTPKVTQFVQAQHWFQDLTTIGF